MNYIRPSGVPADATVIPPVVLSPVQVLIQEYQVEGTPLPAWLAGYAGQANVQAASITRIEAINASLNAQSALFDHNAMNAWEQNVPLYLADGLTPPPPPPPRPTIVTTVLFAKPDGTVETGANASNGSFVAWIWQAYV